jgi:hypothetical protein
LRFQRQVFSFKIRWMPISLNCTEWYRDHIYFMNDIYYPVLTTTLGFILGCSIFLPLPEIMIISFWKYVCYVFLSIINFAALYCE